MGLINAKVGEFSLVEAFAIGFSKSLGERLMAPVIGNGNFLSGTVKLVASWGLPKLFSKDNAIVKVVATGLAVDGVEDMITRVLSGFNVESRTQEASQLI